MGVKYLHGTIGSLETFEHISMKFYRNFSPLQRARDLKICTQAFTVHTLVGIENRVNRSTESGTSHLNQIEKLLFQPIPTKFDIKTCIPTLNLISENHLYRSTEFRTAHKRAMLFRLVY